MKIRIAFPTVLASCLAVALPSTGQDYGPYGSSSTYPAPTAGVPNSYPASTGTLSLLPPTTNPWGGARIAAVPGQQASPSDLPATSPARPEAPAGPAATGETAPLPAPSAGQPASGPQWGSPYKKAMSAPWDATSCNPPTEPCPTADLCVPCQMCPKWFGGVYGLMMDLDNGDQHYFAYDVDDPGVLYMGTDCGCLDMQTAGGVEARLGHTFCNCRLGLEFVYWGVYPTDQARTITAADEGVNGFNTIINYQDAYLDFNGGGAPFSDTIDNQFNVQFPIQAMRVCRSWDFHNAEINLLSGPLTSQPMFASCGGNCGPTGSCHPTRLFGGWILGFRFFNFDEYLGFTAENDDGIIDYNSPDYEFQHDVKVSNDLYGAQLGFHFDYFLTRCFNLAAASSFGIYNNHASVNQGIYNANGPAYTDPADPSDLGFDNSGNDVAFLGELRAGLGYKIGCHWRVTGGYRVVAATGIVRAINQLPEGRVLSDYNYVAEIDRDSVMILHGAYAGVEFAW